MPRITSYLLATIALLGGLAYFSPGAILAQDEAAKTAAAADAESADSEDTATKASSTLGDLVVDSGWVAWIFYGVLGLFSCAALTVTIERLIGLNRGRVIPARFAVGLQQRLANGPASAASLRELCNGDNSPVAKVLHSGLRRAGRTLTEVEKGMEDAIGIQYAILRGRHRLLNVVGSVAPLVGLLGTVVGMIFAFKTSSQVGMGKAELLAEGIYLALMTTAAGLAIAIPCLLLVAWFNAKVDRFLRDLDEQMLDTLPSFAAMENTEQPAAATLAEPPVAATT
jgi:biopolymer transport protein ExbB